MKVKDIVHGYDLGACILAVLCILPSAVVIYMLDPLTRDSILKRAVVGLVAFLGTVLLVPTIARFTERKGLFGRDLGKRHVPSLQNVPVPEALGIVSSLSFMVSVILCQVAFASTFEEKANYNSALTSVCFMVLLGFMDDVLDLPWRAKLILPTIASLPLLITYTGPTSIVVPKPLRGLLVNASMSASSSSSYFLKTTASAMGKKAAAAAATNKMGVLTLLGRAIDSVPYVTVDAEASGAIINLGVFYLVYMGVLAVFCTNAINIYAGINGLEAGQSYVIGCGILLYGLTQLYLMGGIADPEHGEVDGAKYIFATTLIMPFLGSTLGLLWHNWFPSRVFVGDTYCYFAGMTFAVVGIHGHLSKPLWLFFLPQLANFLYSIPQLFKFVPCPRHRLPHVVDMSEKPTSGKNGSKGGSSASAAALSGSTVSARAITSTQRMVASTFEVKPAEHRWLKRLHFLPADAEALPNFTVINLALRCLGRGRVSERDLCVILLALQATSCAVALGLRYSGVATALFDG